MLCYTLIELLPYYCVKLLQSYKMCILITPINSLQRAANLTTPPNPVWFQQQKKRCWSMLQQFGISGAFNRTEPPSVETACKYTCQGCLCFFFSPENVFLHAWDGSLSFVLAAAQPRPAGNTQPWVWNVFTFGACYKLSAKTNFAWLGRGLHLAQMLFGSTVFQGLALSIWLSLSDGASTMPDVNPGKRVTLVIGAGVCVCVHVSHCEIKWRSDGCWHYICSVKYIQRE